ncbi:MAG: hypothetical protein GY801_33480 [bacterium]|nr:hypothetical protein [bacterium]
MLPFTVNNFFYMTSFSTPNASVLKKPRLQKAGLAWLEERLKTQAAAIFGEEIENNGPGEAPSPEHQCPAYTLEQAETRYVPDGRAR